MQSFSCIGSECEDTCCHGWTILVEKSTYKKLKKLRPKDTDLLPVINETFKRNPQAKGDADHAIIGHGESDFCPLLGPSGLCNIHAQLGESYLPKVCADYPRISHDIDGVLELSGSVSCPEVARLALLNPDGIEFDELEWESPATGVNGTTSVTSGDHLPESTRKHFWELRIFIIGVLQNRAYSLDDRLIVLGLFFHKLQDIHDSGRPQDIPALIAQYRQWMDSDVLKESLQTIPKKLQVQLQILKELTDTRYKAKVANPRYRAHYDEFLQGLGYQSAGEAVTSEAVVERYQEAYDRYFRPFMEEHAYILENYLVNYVYSNLHPFEQGMSVYENYVFLMLHYSLVRLQLIGISGYHQGLTIERVISVISSFSRTLEHNKAFMRMLMNLLQAEGMTTLPYMSILVRN